MVVPGTPRGTASTARPAAGQAHVGSSAGSRNGSPGRGPPAMRRRPAAPSAGAGPGLLEEALAGRSQTARRTLLEAYEVGVPMERQDVLRPALTLLGDRWARGSSPWARSARSAPWRGTWWASCPGSASGSGASQGPPAWSRLRPRRDPRPRPADERQRLGRPRPLVHYLGADVPWRPSWTPCAGGPPSCSSPAPWNSTSRPWRPSRAVAPSPGGGRRRGDRRGAGREPPRQEAVRSWGPSPGLDLSPPRSLSRTLGARVAPGSRAGRRH